MDGNIKGNKIRYAQFDKKKNRDENVLEVGVGDSIKWRTLQYSINSRKFRSREHFNT